MFRRIGADNQNNLIFLDISPDVEISRTVESLVGKNMENQLFIIPIYLRSPDQYDQEKRIKEKKETEKYGEVQFRRKYELNWPPWQYNDVIGYFEICVNSYKVISVIKYLTEYQRISRNPWAKKKHAITFQMDFTFTPFYQKLSKYFNNQEMELKHRLSNILNELDKVIKKERRFIETAYYKNILEYLDIEGFISVSGDN